MGSDRCDLAQVLSLKLIQLVVCINSQTRFCTDPLFHKRITHSRSRRLNEDAAYVAKLESSLQDLHEGLVNAPHMHTCSSLTAADTACFHTGLFGLVYWKVHPPMTLHMMCARQRPLQAPGQDSKSQFECSLPKPHKCVFLVIWV